jgi:hypothetical protein
VTALAEFEAEAVQQRLLVRLGKLRDELVRIDGLVQAHPRSTKLCARLVAGMADSANNLEALLSGARE